MSIGRQCGRLLRTARGASAAGLARGFGGSAALPVLGRQRCAHVGQRPAVLGVSSASQARSFLSSSSSDVEPYKHTFGSRARLWIQWRQVSNIWKDIDEDEFLEGARAVTHQVAAMVDKGDTEGLAKMEEAFTPMSLAHLNDLIARREPLFGSGRLTSIDNIQVVAMRFDKETQTHRHGKTNVFKSFFQNKQDKHEEDDDDDSHRPSDSTGASAKPDTSHRHVRARRFIRRRTPEATRLQDDDDHPELNETHIWLQLFVEIIATVQPGAVGGETPRASSTAAASESKDGQGELAPSSSTGSASTSDGDTQSKDSSGSAQACHGNQHVPEPHQVKRYFVFESPVFAAHSGTFPPVAITGVAPQPEWFLADVEAEAPSP